MTTRPIAAASRSGQPLNPSTQALSAARFPQIRSDPRVTPTTAASLARRAPRSAFVRAFGGTL